MNPPCETEGRGGDLAENSPPPLPSHQQAAALMLI